MIKKIVQKENPILRKTAGTVTQEIIGSEKLSRIIREMSEALAESEDGVAIAGPQLGYSLRLFVVSQKAFEIGTNEDTENSLRDKRKPYQLVYINPTITRKSSKKVVLDEGCLSVRGIFGKIERHEKVTIEALDEHGKKFSRGASGLLAEIFQHETDHLRGILFTDTAKNLIKMVKKQSESK
ncbi:MAG: peptide deformylase [Candidatus Vogelbacteria bacterium]|nr:peptide deformylase [Candidatus Vogelbacteria bacterium]